MSYVSPWLISMLVVEELPKKQASQLAAKLTGIKPKLFYKAGLAVKNN